MVDPKAKSNKTRPKEEERAERKGRKKITQRVRGVR
jgi:hypothetical protein